jgi:hypothetical protein
MATDALPGFDHITPRLHSLGTFHPQVNVLSQQIRALEGIYRLNEGVWNAPLSERTLLVVGAGFGGMTAAVAAARLGWQVTVLEHRHAPFHLQQGCHTRWLYPYIREWPRQQAHQEEADLPVMPWTAGPASQVARQFSKRYEAAVRESTQPIATHYSVPTISITTYADHCLVEWPPACRADPRHVLLAVGFGVEGTIPGIALSSYWRNDALAQAKLDGTSTERHHVVISGTGDGGLMDAVRVRLGEFDDLEMARSIERISGDAWPVLQRQLVELEQRAWAASWTDAGKTLAYGYAQLHIPGDLVGWLQGRLRKDTRVTLVHRDDQWQTRNAQALNRFLTHLLQLHDQPNFTIVRGTAQWGVVQPSFASLYFEDQDATIQGNAITIRHGAKNPLKTKTAHLTLGDAADPSSGHAKRIKEIEAEHKETRPIPLTERCRELNDTPVYWKENPLFDHRVAQQILVEMGKIEPIGPIEPPDLPDGITIVCGARGDGTTVRLLQIAASMEAAIFVDVPAAARGERGAEAFRAVSRCLAEARRQAQAHERTLAVLVNGVDDYLITDRRAPAHDLAALLAADTAVRTVLSINLRPTLERDKIRALGRDLDLRSPELIEKFPLATQPFLSALCSAGARLQLQLLPAEGAEPRIMTGPHGRSGIAQLRHRREAIRNLHGNLARRIASNVFDHEYEHVLAFHELLDRASDGQAGLAEILEATADERTHAWLKLSELVSVGRVKARLAELLPRMIGLAHVGDQDGRDVTQHDQIRRIQNRLCDRDVFSLSNLISLYLRLGGHLEDVVPVRATSGRREMRLFHLRGVYFPPDKPLGQVDFIGIDFSARSRVREAILRSPDASFIGCSFADTDMKDLPEKPKHLDNMDDASWSSSRAAW